MKTVQITAVVLTNAIMKHEDILVNYDKHNCSYFVKTSDGTFNYNSEEMCNVYGLEIAELKEIQQHFSKTQIEVNSEGKIHTLIFSPTICSDHISRSAMRNMLNNKYTFFITENNRLEVYNEENILSLCTGVLDSNTIDILKHIY